jgi:hypothetical protein
VFVLGKPFQLSLLESVSSVIMLGVAIYLLFFLNVTLLSVVAPQNKLECFEMSNIVFLFFQKRSSLFE